LPAWQIFFARNPRNRGRFRVASPRRVEHLPHHSQIVPFTVLLGDYLSPQLKTVERNSATAPFPRPVSDDISLAPVTLLSASVVHLPRMTQRNFCFCEYTKSVSLVLTASLFESRNNEEVSPLVNLGSHFLMTCCLLPGNLCQPTQRVSGTCPGWRKSTRISTIRFSEG
jgi:hypothetical protein